MRGFLNMKHKWSPGARSRQEKGSIIIIAMVFILVFLGMIAALFVLLRSSMADTELERKEVKAFNVAEAGIDAGMLKLKNSWPETEADSAMFSTSELNSIRAQFPSDQYREARRSSTPFLSILIYDNTTVTASDPKYLARRDRYLVLPDGTIHPKWDAGPLNDQGKPDGIMVVDSRANVDDDRHRIMILAERHSWDLDFKMIAMYANTAGGNGPGLRVRVDPDQTEPLPLNGAAAPAYYNGTTRKGVNLPRDSSIIANPSPAGSFDNWVDPALMTALKGIAQTEKTYFTDVTAAERFLVSSAALDKIVYVESDSPIIIAANTQIGSRAQPVVLVLDTPDGTQNALDFRGTADFYGIVVAKGQTEVRGTSSFWGSFICSEVLVSDGGGSSPEINYSGDIIKKINRRYVLSVNIVPNTWEEYTPPPNQ